VTIDFEQEVDHYGVNSIKWEFVVDDRELKHWDLTDPDLGDQSILPMWVADMDFLAAPPIVEAVTRRAQRGLYGYASKTDSYLSAVCGWMARHKAWAVNPEWILMMPGVVTALHVIVRHFTAPGDKVLIQRPVYHPFTFSIENNQREVASSALRLTGDRYEMDFDDLAEKAADPAAKLAILCSPHNPVGRVWSREELTRYAEICSENGVRVIADELHSDLIMPGGQFVSYGTLDERFLKDVFVCTAPSKTFSLAGLQTSNIIVPDAELRDELRIELRALGLWGTNPFGLVGTEAAYNHGEPWLEQVIDYIWGNLEYLDNYLKSRLSSMKLIPIEGTYLAWIDCRGLGLDGAALNRLMMDDARVYVDGGHIFGPEGEGFVRINVACRRQTLEQALARIERAVNDQIGG
jgi:cystathionine beta-lyase